MTTRHANGRMRRVDGWRREPVDQRDMVFRVGQGVHPLLELPARVDNRSTCPRVEDQADIGSCTAQAGTSLVEHCHLRAGEPAPDLSRLFTYYTTRVDVAGWDPDDDSGAYIRDTLKSLARYGSCEERLWPYRTGEFGTRPSDAAYDAANLRRVTEYRRCDGLSGVKEALAAGLCVEGGFDVPEGIFSAECQLTGLVPELQPGEEPVGGHAVLFCGYDDASQTLLFQNSWGTGWGDGGYGRLPYVYLYGHASDFWTVTAAMTPTPVPPDPYVPRKRCWLLRLFDALSGT